MFVARERTIHNFCSQLMFTPLSPCRGRGHLCMLQFISTAELVEFAVLERRNNDGRSQGSSSHGGLSLSIWGGNFLPKLVTLLEFGGSLIPKSFCENAAKTINSKFNQSTWVGGYLADNFNNAGQGT